MSSSAALLQFAAEFVLFLVAAAGVGSLLVDAENGGRQGFPRLVVAAGFLALAVSAVVRGSDLAGDSDTVQVVGLRAVGVVLLAAESVRSPLRPRARMALWIGLALLVGAGAADVADEATVTGLLLTAGAVLVGVSVVVAGQRSIATRVSTSAAGIVLVVVLVLGVTISAVLLATVQDGVVERLERRAGNEASGAQDVATQLAGAARIVAGTLGGTPLRPTLERLADQPEASDTLSPSLVALSENFLEDASLAFVSRRGAAQGAVNLTTAELVALTGSEVVGEALASGAARNAVEVVVGNALAIRVEPVPLDGRPPLLGVAVAATPLDRTYLVRAAQDDGDLSLALVTSDEVLASFGSLVAPARMTAIAAQVLDGGGTFSGTVGSRFVAVAPVGRGDGSPSAALVASYPTALVADTRDDLFRILFLIALVGTVIALGLASLVGSRIGGRLRLLTEAARSVRRGDMAVRTAITSDDEIGVLSSTFDAMARSVAEKTAAESALRGRLEAVVAGMGDALVAVDEGGDITDFNPAAEKLIGLVAAEARGRPVGEVVRLTDAEGHSLTGDLRSREQWSGRCQVEGAGGVMVTVAVSVGTLDLPGVKGGGGSVVNLRDLRAEELVERVQTQLLSRFSHEYRSPLTPIMGYAKQLADGPVPTDDLVREWGAIIHKASKDLERIVRMQEFFAQVAAGRMDVAKQWVEPASLVDAAVRRWRPRLVRATGISRRRVDRRLPPIYQDETILGACLDELIDNADKFSPDGGRIAVSAATGPDGWVKLTVTDAGIGMTDEEKERAFQPFGQADTSDTREYGGLGLGLSFVREAVVALGGEVESDSAPGEGSKFSILLPALPREGQR